MKFLIIQTAFIGDVILATALVEKLHRHYPEATIDFALRKGNEGLLTLGGRCCFGNDGLGRVARVEDFVIRQELDDPKYRETQKVHGVEQCGVGDV